MRRIIHKQIFLYLIRTVVVMRKIYILFSRMGEVDQNLNYMLGQLSLVVQEFNQVSITQCPTNVL